MLRDLGLSHVLLLQGPMGPFFRRLARELEEQGVRVTKLNFNAGDGFYFPRGLSYRGSLADLPAFVERLVKERGIDGVLLFGDGRPIHRAIIEQSARLGLKVFVFEEGYLRPDWITLEPEGVNGHSTLPRDPAFYRGVDDHAAEAERPQHVGQTFRYGAWHSTVYSLAMTLGFFLYPRYRHHRPLNAWAEAYRWVLSGARKLRFQWRERHVLDELVTRRSGHFFLVALQVHCDYQLFHSRFGSIESFIEEVVASFAQHASPEDSLVVKHHPMDRPYREYASLIASLRNRHRLGDRLIYVHDLHLPTLLKYARGAVMINSTVGLQSIQVGTPVKMLGEAVYDMPGLTSQVPLERFWREPGTVDLALYRKFRAHLLQTIQANGAFYKRLPGVETPTGVRWTKGPRAFRPAER